MCRRAPSFRHHGLPSFPFLSFLDPRTTRGKADKMPAGSCQGPSPAVLTELAATPCRWPGPLPPTSYGPRAPPSPLAQLSAAGRNGVHLAEGPKLTWGVSVRGDPGHQRSQWGHGEEPPPPPTKSHGAWTRGFSLFHTRVPTATRQKADGGAPSKPGSAPCAGAVGFAISTERCSEARLLTFRTKIVTYLASTPPQICS